MKAIYKIGVFGALIGLASGYYFNKEYQQHMNEVVRTSPCNINSDEIPDKIEYTRKGDHEIFLGLGNERFMPIKTLKNMAKYRLAKEIFNDLDEAQKIADELLNRLERISELESLLKPSK